MAAPKPDLQAGPRAWGPAPAWNKPQDEKEDKEEFELKEGETECYICFNSAAKIQLKPCKHTACIGCVQQLRRANILKVQNNAYVIMISAGFSEIGFLIRPRNHDNELASSNAHAYARTQIC